MKTYRLNTWLGGLLLMLTSAAQANIPEALTTIQTGWAVAQYQTTGARQKVALEQLVAQSDAQLKQYPQSAELWIWNGIVKSSLAGARGGLGALSLAKAAKESLEQAITLNPNALEGSAFTSLGTLYARVPGWPVGFGDDEKAETLLQRALSINPNGIDPNFFYASFLADQDRRDEARQYYLKARRAAPRPGRALADQGRQSEITAALAQLPASRP